MSASPTPTSAIPTIAPSLPLLVSLLATPWLVAIVTVNTTSRLLEQLGLASEEIFRGDRLPVLHLPIDEISATDYPRYATRERDRD
jgi:hypothetical protein